MHKTIAKTSFLIVEYFNCAGFKCFDVYAMTCSWSWTLCLRIPPYPMSDASVSIILNVYGIERYRHLIDWTLSLISLTKLKLEVTE